MERKILNVSELIEILQKFPSETIPLILDVGKGHHYSITAKDIIPENHPYFGNDHNIQGNEEKIGLGHWEDLDAVEWIWDKQFLIIGTT